MKQKLTSLLLSSMIVSNVAAAKSKPNVVILLSDDLGYKDISCYGGPVQTPNLDKLAAQGARFTDFYSGSAVCSPSRATLLTGRHHIRTGVYTWIHDKSQRSHLLERETTIAEVLKNKGYATGHFGKWHLGYPSKKFPNKPTPDKHGFDYWFATENNAIPNHHNPINFVRNGTPVGKLNGYSCQLVVDEAINWLDNHRTDDKPFFINMWFHEPHSKIAAPNELCDKYDGDTKQKTYSGTIDNTDIAIGRLLEKLTQVAPKEDTIIIYSSDNGSDLPERNGDLRGKKASNYDGGIRVPGIVYWPGTIAAGQTITEPAGLVDMLPTLCSVCDAAKPSVHLDGADIMPLLLGKQDTFTRQQPLFWHLQQFWRKEPGEPIVAMRDGRYSLVAEPAKYYREKVVFNEQNIPRLKNGTYTKFKLFDLQNDPNQTKNLAATHPELLDSMKKKLLKINKSIMADGPDWHLEK